MDLCWMFHIYPIVQLTLKSLSLQYTQGVIYHKLHRVNKSFVCWNPIHCWHSKLPKYIPQLTHNADDLSAKFAQWSFERLSHSITAISYINVRLKLNSVSHVLSIFAVINVVTVSYSYKPKWCLIQKCSIRRPH